MRLALLFFAAVVVGSSLGCDTSNSGGAGGGGAPGTSQSSTGGSGGTGKPRTGTPSGSQCATPTPATNATCADGGAGSTGECSLDSDCGKAAGGRCLPGNEPESDGCECKYFCATDDDCPAQSACTCDGQNGMGRCVTALCRTDADCSNGKVCASLPSDENDCTTTAVCVGTDPSSCGAAGPCTTGQQCVYAGGMLECSDDWSCEL